MKLWNVVLLTCNLKCWAWHQFILHLRELLSSSDYLTETSGFFPFLLTSHCWAKERNYEAGALEIDNTRPNSYSCKITRYSVKWDFWVDSTSTGVSWFQIVGMIQFMMVKGGILSFFFWFSHDTHTSPLGKGTVGVRFSSKDNITLH